MNLQVGHSQEYGLVTVTIPAGAKGEVKVNYGLSLATQIGGLISVTTAGLGVVWLIVSAILDRRQRKKQAEMSHLMDSVREVVEDDILEAEFNREADKETIIASLGEPKQPEMPSVMPPDLPVPQAVSPLQTPVVSAAGEVTTEAKPKRTRTTKATKTTKAKVAKTASAKTTAKKKVATKQTATTKAKAKTVSAEAPRRTTTTRVRTVKSDEVEDE